PHIVSVNNTHEYDEAPDTPYTLLQIASRQAPGVWNIDTVDDGDMETVFVYPSFTYDSNWHPAVAYISESSANPDNDLRLCYAIDPGSGWVSQMLTGISAGGQAQRLGFNCALAFGVFNVEDVVR
ncbi:MAG: hypothetical protein GW875_14935, partial [Deltaproteobacteria bacterium]|nr:hypothetical protein [Deltaproteobacteria bacterium]